MRYWKITVELPLKVDILLYSGEFANNNDLVSTFINIIEQHHKDNVNILNWVEENNSEYKFNGDFEIITQNQFNKLSKLYKIIKQ